MHTSMVHSNETERQIERARGGDRAAFDELMAEHSGALLASIRRRMGTTLGERIEPEDLVQETLVRAFRSLESFEWRGEGSFRRWLDGIAGHVVLHSARTQSRNREFQISRAPNSACVSPSRQQRREERFDRLKSALDRLSPDHQRVIRLSRIEGLKVGEIAERMGRSESSVKSLLFRAMTQLREGFGDTESLSLPARSLDEEGDADVK